MSRRDDIRNRLAAHLLEGRGVAVVCPSTVAMATYPVAGSFGWFPPMPIEEGNSELLIVTFSPELLAEMTESLTYEELDTYLRVVEMFLDRYIEAIERGEDGNEAREQAESELLDTEPEALALFSEVEARALDTGLVQRPPAT
jgi:hypothetical protein